VSTHFSSKCVLPLIFSEDGLSIPFFNIGRNLSRNVSLTRTLTQPLRTPDWLLRTNGNPTLPQQSQADSSEQNLQTTFSSAEDIQSKQNNKQVAAVTIDIHDHPEASTTQKEDIDAGRKVIQLASILEMPSHGDTAPDSTRSKSPTPDILEESRVEKHSTTPKVQPLTSVGNQWW
jgi:hypothetical protein